MAAYPDTLMVTAKSCSTSICHVLFCYSTLQLPSNFPEKSSFVSTLNEEYFPILFFP